MELALDRRAGAPPLYRQIANHLRAGILAGALASGVRLPPERALADRLQVNRVTVMRAFAELADEGLVARRPGRGTRVRAPLAGDAYGRSAGAAGRADGWLYGLPPVARGQVGPDVGVLREITAGEEDGAAISFGAGTPSGDLLPLALIQAALERALGRLGAAALNYGTVEGMEPLRLALAEHLGRRGVVIAPDEVMAVSGATQGIALIAQALLEPGDTVVTEAPTYIGALQTFAAAGARVIGLPVDGYGLRVDALEATLARQRVRLIFVQPNQQNPTGVTMTPARRERLMWLSRRYGVPVVEDDAYGELWQAGGPPPAPLKAADRHGLVVMVGTFSKTLAPGLRVGWVAAPAAVIGRLALAKQFADLSSGALGQAAVAELLTSGAYLTHLEWLRGVYAERRAAMVAALAVVPSLRLAPEGRGGFYLWGRLQGGRSARRVASQAHRAGVTVLPGDLFYPPMDRGQEDGRDRLRLSFASATVAEIEEGVARLARVVDGLAADDAGETALGSIRPVV